MRKLTFILVFFLLSVSAFAADTVLTWPAGGGEPIIRFSVGKLRQVNSAAGQTDYLGDALAENLSKKAIPSASFYLYLLDKNGKRVGEGYLEVTNLAAGQQAKIAVTAHAMGSFARMEIQPQHLPSDEPMKIKMSISSTPAGASVKLDSQDSGVTPKLITVAPGKHVLEFSKEGYASASTPLEVDENAMPGSVNVDLNPLTVDTVVLRDGSVLTGNVTAVTTASVAINVKGKPTRVPRVRVARIVFGESETKTTKTSSSARKKK